jgi:DNA-binding LacI/PurR family transcriptional regulator
MYIARLTTLPDMPGPQDFKSSADLHGKPMRDSFIQTPGVTTQRDIASRLGISNATVSLALRDHPRIPITTRERIKQIAHEMGYQPIPGLRMVSSDKSSPRQSSRLLPLGWINAWSQPGKLAKHREYGGYWRGACEEASQLGYRLEEFQLHPDTTLKEVKRRLRIKGFRGLLLPPDGDPAALKHFPWENYHVVSLSHYTTTPATHLVAPDRVGNCSLAFEMMRKRGYRRIGFLTDQFPETINDKLSVAGFLSAQWELSENEHLPVFTTRDHPLPRQLSQWVTGHRLDAILTDLSDAFRLLQQTGLRIPQDLGLAFSSCSQTAGAAGIDCHPEEVGRIGLETLERSIGGYLNPEFKIRVAVNGHWRDGRTLPIRLEGE